MCSSCSSTASSPRLLPTRRHQPFNGDCKGLPPSGQVRWTDIAVEVNGKKVANPEWQAKEESPVCGAKTVVVNSTAIDITWTPAT